MRKSTIKYLSLLTVLSVLAVSGCDFIYKTGFVPIPPQPVSGPIEIGSEWQEIVPPSPLRRLGQNWINLTCPEADTQKTELGTQVITLLDGRKSQISVIIFDNNNSQEYALDIGVLGGNAVGLSRKKNTGQPYESLPQDRKYTKLKIKSEIPLQCEKIEWISHIPY